MIFRWKFLKSRVAEITFVAVVEGFGQPSILDVGVTQLEEEHVLSFVDIEFDRHDRIW